MLGATTELGTRSDTSKTNSNNKETARLQAVLEVGRNVTSILDLDRLLAESVRLIRQTFNYELVTIYLRDLHDQDFYFKSHYDGNPASSNMGHRGVMRNPVSTGMVGWVFRNEQHRLANDVTQDPYYYYCCSEDMDEPRAELDLPLKMNGKVIGVLDLESSKVNAFDPADIPFLEILADQIAVAIHNARLTARAREAAIAEERNRLARNLHDDTVQALIGITRQLDLLRCDLGDEFSEFNTEACGAEVSLPPHVERRLDRLQDSLDRTIQGLRLLSRELQPQLLRDLGLAAAIDALACDITRTSNLEIKVQVCESAKNLGAEQQLEVYRVAQEALSNIVKHANASRVFLTLDLDDDKVVLNINDNGQGFEVPEDLSNLARRGGMGVLSMRQRACSVGGFLTISSQLGAGTALSMEVPVAAEN